MRLKTKLLEINGGGRFFVMVEQITPKQVANEDHFKNWASAILRPYLLKGEHVAIQLVEPLEDKGT